MVNQRNIIMFLGFYAVTLLYVNRAALSVAIVSMVKPKNAHGHSHRMQGSCIIDNNVTDQKIIGKRPSGTFEWSETLQGLILGAPLYSNVFVPIISGWISDRFGSKYLTAVSVLFPGLLATLIPTAAYTHVYLLITLLFIQGCLNNCMVSSLFSMFANWFPADEMATATGALAFGANFGLVVMFPIAGYLCQHVDWSAVFYVAAVMHIPWIFGWLWSATDLPVQSRRITQEELEYIQKHCAAKKTSDQKMAVPWKKLLTSKPVWASTCAKLSEYFGYFLLLNKMPCYLDQVFGLSMTDNGIINAIVHLSTSLVELIGGPLSAWLIKLDIFSVTTTRKIFESSALIGPAICTVLIPYFGCDATVVIGLLIGSMTAYGLITGGDWPITAEFAPDLAGTVFGFTLTISILMSFVAPIVAGVMLDEAPGDKNQWNTIFYLTAGIYLIGAVIFDVLASAEPQSWAVSKVDKNDRNSDDANVNEMNERNKQKRDVIEVNCKIEDYHQHNKNKERNKC